MDYKIFRDESTPDRREIWDFVERAAARSYSMTEIRGVPEKTAPMPETPATDLRQRTSTRTSSED